MFKKTGKIIMLDYIKGSIKSVNQASVTVDIGAIAFCLQVATPSAFGVGQKVEFYSYMHWNQENGPSLFGFLSEIEKEIFLLVISCSGVGPKLGLAVLQDIGPQAFLDAVSQEDDRLLSKVSGIGAKKAEQIIVHLKHKVSKLIQSGAIIEALGQTGTISRIHEVSDVLKSLNYSRQEISAAMNYLGKNHTKQDFSFDQLVRHALSFLSKKGATKSVPR
ncbi:Holliday junction branch migration protein RuvA [Candidatus Dependentiae bacterium]